MHQAARAVFLLAALFSGCVPSGVGADRARSTSLMAPSPPDRGRYLALHVSLCIFCHSEIDWNAEGFPPRPGAAGGGRSPFSDAMPWPAAPNLSPDPETGAGRWADEAFERALRRGIGHDGRTLHPLMPYTSFRGMSDEDVESVVQYLRSLPPVGKRIPPPEVPAEIRAALRRKGPPPGSVPPPDRSTPAGNGEYLATLAICGSCHTPVDEKGKPIAGMEFSGGVRLKGPWGDLHTTNITPDGSGIQDLGEKGFVHTMKTGQLPGRTLNGIMPWGYYRHMTEDDLRAIYAYLRTLNPVRHPIDNSVAPTPCRRCGNPHGLGSRN